MADDGGGGKAAPVATSASTAASTAAAAAAFMTQVKQMVDDKLSAFSSAFFSDSRSSTQEIADRIDAISDAVLSGCDDSGLRGGDATKVSMVKSRAAMLDRLRTGRPDVYSALRTGASNVAFAPPLQQRAALEAAIKSLS